MNLKNIKKANKKLEMKMQKNKFFLMQMIQRCAFFCSPGFFGVFYNLFLDSMTKRNFKNIKEVGMWFLLTSGVVVSSVFTTELLEENKNINPIIQKRILKRQKTQLNIYKFLRALSFSIYTFSPAICGQKIVECLANARGENLSKAVSYGLVAIVSCVAAIKFNETIVKEKIEMERLEEILFGDLDIIDLDTEEGELRLAR